MSDAAKGVTDRGATSRPEATRVAAPAEPIETSTRARHRPSLPPLPRDFMDPLPKRASEVRLSARRSRPDRDATFAEAQPWLSGPYRAAFMKRFEPKLADPAFRTAAEANAKAPSRMERGGGQAESRGASAAERDRQGEGEGEGKAQGVRKGHGTGRGNPAQIAKCLRATHRSLSEPRFGNSTLRFSRYSSWASALASYVSYQVLQANARGGGAAARRIMMEAASSSRTYTNDAGQAAAGDAAQVPVSAAVGAGVRRDRAVQRHAQEISGLQRTRRRRSIRPIRATAPPIGRPTS